MAFGLAVRLYGIADVGPVEDEYYQLFAALHSASLPEFLSLLRQNPHHVLLDPLLTFVFAHLGSGLWLLRLPAALAGTLSVYAVWRLCQRAAGPVPSALAAFAMAGCLLHVDWSRRVDFYGALPAAAAFQAAAFLRGRWRAYGLWTAVFFYLHPYALLSLPAHGAWLVWQRRAALRSWITAAAGAVLAFSPWLFYSTKTLADHTVFDFSGAWKELPGWLFLVRAPLYLGQSVEVGPWRFWHADTAGLLSAVSLGLFLVSAITNRRRGTRFCHWMVAYGLLAVVAVDLWYRYYFTGRQLLWIAPFYFVAVADGATKLLRRIHHRALMRVQFGLCAAVLTLWLPLYLDATQLQIEAGERARSFADAVRSGARPGDTLAFQTDDLTLASFLWFYDKSSFARLDGLKFHAAENGQLSFLVPPKLTAGNRNPVKLVGLQAPPQPRWLFTGSVFDLSVEPPVRPHLKKTRRRRR